MAEPEAQAAEVTAQAETTSTESAWYGDDNKELVESKGWKSGDDALKSYRELEKTFSGRVKIPGEDATPEERAKFNEKIGVPSDTDGYEISVPEEISSIRDEGIENTMKEVALEAGVPKVAFEKIVGSYYEKIAADMQAGMEQGMTALRDELGDKYEAEVEIAKRFAGNCSEEFRGLVESTGLGNNPIFIKEFISLGKKTMSDSLVRGTADNNDDKGYKPRYSSPDMYATGDDAESVKARAYFTKRGHKY
jgi:hypothetical protein